MPSIIIIIGVFSVVFRIIQQNAFTKTVTVYLFELNGIKKCPSFALLTSLNEDILMILLYFYFWLFGFMGLYKYVNLFAILISPT